MRQLLMPQSNNTILHKIFSEFIISVYVRECGPGWGPGLAHYTYKPFPIRTKYDYIHFFFYAERFEHLKKKKNIRIFFPSSRRFVNYNVWFPYRIRVRVLTLITNSGDICIISYCSTAALKVAARLHFFLFFFHCQYLSGLNQFWLSYTLYSTVFFAIKGRAVHSKFIYLSFTTRSLYR